MEKESKFNSISLSLVVPVYNEELCLYSALEANLMALNNYVSISEIIIVNDGSDDNSQMIIDEFIKENMNARSIKKENNEGIGSAIKAGIENAKYDFILPVPVDCPLDNNTLHDFLSQINNYDVIIGYRTKREGYSLRMQVNSYVFHKLISWLFNIKLKDYNWIHLYRRKIFIIDNIQIHSKGILMLAEVLIRGHRKNLLFNEIEIKQQKRLTGVATASRFKTILQTLKEIMQLYKDLN